jgi:hypothetical protein
VGEERRLLIWGLGFGRNTTLAPSVDLGLIWIGVDTNCRISPLLAGIPPACSTVLGCSPLPRSAMDWLGEPLLIYDPTRITAYARTKGGVG